MALLTRLVRAAASGRGSADKPYVISRASVRTQVRSPRELLSQAVLLPNAGGGFLVKDVQSNSLIEEFGLRAGDVVRRVNAQPLHYADDIRRVYEQLRNVSDVKIELVRDRKPQTLHYRVVEGPGNAARLRGSTRTTHGDSDSLSREPTTTDLNPPQPPDILGDERSSDAEVPSSNF